MPMWRNADYANSETSEPFFVASVISVIYTLSAGFGRCARNHLAAP